MKNKEDREKRKMQALLSSKILAYMPHILFNTPANFSAFSSNPMKVLLQYKTMSNKLWEQGLLL
jgi:hypothetical protein